MNSVLEQHTSEHAELQQCTSHPMPVTTVSTQPMSTCSYSVMLVKVHVIDKEEHGREHSVLSISIQSNLDILRMTVTACWEPASGTIELVETILD